MMVMMMVMMMMMMVMITMVTTNWNRFGNEHCLNVAALPCPIIFAPDYHWMIMMMVNYRRIMKTTVNCIVEKDGHVKISL